jgi:5-formaminoimidazole-4-carboxamide-1-(beta)-D-ribofuranosyl 5'-monophosphate synthetase
MNPLILSMGFILGAGGPAHPTIPTKYIHEILESYDRKKITVVTAASHSALQIIHGAQKEGLKTALVCDRKREKLYKSFQKSKPDEFIYIDEWDDFLRDNIQEELKGMNGIVVTHGSFVEYIKSENLLEYCDVPQFGNRKVLEWESDRQKQREWLEGKAGLKMPKHYKLDEFEEGKLAIVKFGGAKGGQGFFKIKSKDEADKILDEMKLSENERSKITIQEYIAGSRYYHHFFYSPLDKKREWQVKVEGKNVGRLELNGMDRRDETNIDDLHRAGLNPTEMKKAGIRPSYTVCGNIPLVMRESLLPKVFEMGEKTVKASLELFPGGMIGPFCLETFVTSDLDHVVFEISTRIVAGTNIYPAGSPYADYDWGEKAEMSMGRRIAREIKLAARTNRLKEVIV